MRWRKLPWEKKEEKHTIRWREKKTFHKMENTSSSNLNLKKKISFVR